jgi:hypothetical protein
VADDAQRTIGEGFELREDRRSHRHRPLESYRSSKRRQVRGRFWLAVMLALPPLTACSSGSDVLDLGQTRLGYCLQTPEQGDAAIFGTVLRHRGETPVTIADVSLVGADNMILEEAALLEMDSGEGGPGAMYLSEAAETLSESWPTRLRAEGARIEPGEDWALSLTVSTRESGEATAEAAKITYRADPARERHQNTLVEMAVAPDCETLMTDGRR